MRRAAERTSGQGFPVEAHEVEHVRPLRRLRAGLPAQGHRRAQARLRRRRLGAVLRRVRRGGAQPGCAWSGIVRDGLIMDLPRKDRGETLTLHMRGGGRGGADGMALP